MTVVVVGSVRGAPGVTSAALLLAGWLDDSAVAEAELDGGVIAVRYGLGREPGLTTLAAGHAIDPEDWRQHTQDAGGVPVLVGPDAPDRMAMLWSRAGRRLGTSLAGSRATVVVDAGRLRPGGVTSELLTGSALTILLLRPVPDDLVGLAHRLPALPGSVGLVLVGSGAYSTSDVRAEFGVDVLGTLPDDRRAAALLADGGMRARGLARTPVARAMHTVADAVVSRVQQGDRPGNGTGSGRTTTAEAAR